MHSNQTFGKPHTCGVPIEIIIIPSPFKEIFFSKELRSVLWKYNVNVLNMHLVAVCLPSKKNCCKVLSAFYQSKLFWARSQFSMLEKMINQRHFAMSYRRYWESNNFAINVLGEKLVLGAHGINLLERRYCKFYCRRCMWFYFIRYAPHERSREINTKFYQRKKSAHGPNFGNRYEFVLVCVWGFNFWTSGKAAD